MTSAPLTPKEQAIFDHLKLGKTSLDDLMKAIDAAMVRGAWGQASRQSAIMGIKYLGAKIAADGWCIVRTTPVGRGHKGEYEMRRIAG